jgi:prepilin-type N-terminal cleavage/methylation domain-containing protein
MKATKLHRQQGFTLVEVIAVLILMGIVALALATTMVTAVEGYLFTKDSADGAQKGQLALARISKELLQATAITTATSTIVAYTTPAGSFQIVKMIMWRQITAQKAFSFLKNWMAAPGLRQTISTPCML